MCLVAMEIAYLRQNRPPRLINTRFHTKISHCQKDCNNPLCSQSLEKAVAPHSSALAWRTPGTEEPGGLPSMGSHRVGHDWSDLAAAAAAIQRHGPGSCFLFGLGLFCFLPFLMCWNPHSSGYNDYSKACCVPLLFHYASVLGIVRMLGIDKASTRTEVVPQNPSGGREVSVLLDIAKDIAF